MQHSEGYSLSSYNLPGTCADCRDRVQTYPSRNVLIQTLSFFRQSEQWGRGGGDLPKITEKDSNKVGSRNQTS